MKTKILIVDDHPVTRTGIRTILLDEGNIEIIGEAMDGRDAVKQVDAKTRAQTSLNDLLRSAD